MSSDWKEPGFIPKYELHGGGTETQKAPLALSVLQIPALDIGTDLLPALALGSEAPSKGALKRPPERRYLMDRALMFRVFGLLGPVEALMEMTAYTAVLLGTEARN